MVEDLEKVCDWSFTCTLVFIYFLATQGDVAETAKIFFEESSLAPPAKKSTLTLAQVWYPDEYSFHLFWFPHCQQVDAFLDRMTLVTKEEDQKIELSKIIRRWELLSILWCFDELVCPMSLSVCLSLSLSDVHLRIWSTLSGLSNTIFVSLPEQNTCQWNTVMCSTHTCWYMYSVYI